MLRGDDKRKKVNVKEKFGDYLMDISEYVFTAVIITTIFNELVIKHF